MRHKISGDPMAQLVTDCWWWFESLLVHSGVSSATRRKVTGADHKKNNEAQDLLLLQDCACKLTHTHALLQQKELLAGVINEQDAEPYACINVLEQAIIANSIALDSVLNAVCTAKVHYSSQ